MGTSLEVEEERFVPAAAGARQHAVVLGAGLAGLACAYELAVNGMKVTVIERESHVGGMASSFVQNGDGEFWSYDFGPHRFHTYDQDLIAHVEHILGGNHLPAKRLSRIVLFDRFFDYPLKAGNVLRNLPTRVLIRAFFDYFLVQFTQRVGLTHHRDDNFEGWVTKRFGRTLYDLFFGTYTEKTWKMAPSQISADWASQRISQLNLWDTVKKTLSRPRRGEAPRSLVTDFLYPSRGGIGEIARGYVRQIEALGGTVATDAPVTRIHREASRVTGIQYGGPTGGTVTGDHYISTIPITALARSVRPSAPQSVRDAIANLRYISIVFIYLKLAKQQVTPDNWVYIPEQHLDVHRISEFKNFSPNCAPPGRTMICAEITCRIGDQHWRASDEELVSIAVSDLTELGLVARDEVLDSFVKRIPHAYPVYDLDYKANLTPIIEFVHSLENIMTGGRQGLFRYNNMDQSIEMGRKMAWELLQGTGVAHEAVATGQEYFG